MYEGVSCYACVSHSKQTDLLLENGLLVKASGAIGLASDQVMVDQSRGHSCDSTFFSSLVQLIPCRRAVSPFSPTLPSMACCNAVKALGQPCLCVLVKGPSVSGVDRGMTLQLPEKCSTNFDPCELTRK